MNPTDARAIVVEAVRSIAPGAAIDELGPADDLIDALELDSMDLLNIAVAVAERTGIEIPERDYPKLTSIEVFAAYLVAAAG